MKETTQCNSCTPYESRLTREGRAVGFTKEQIEWLAENFEFAQEDD